MIRIFKLVLLLVVSQVAFGQAPSNYTNINGRYRWIAGMFDSTFHIPKGTTPSLRTGGSANGGALFYKTADSSLQLYTGTQWLRMLKVGDTTGMLTPYFNSVGVGLKNTGQTVYADTLLLSTRLWRNKGIDSVQANLTAGLATKLNISDTASMLSPYARKNFLNAGTGISYSSTTGTIANTAPDQTVALNAGTGISISGTYPNFTITNSSPSSGGTVTSVGSNNGTGLTGGPITTSGTLAIDTLLVSTRAWRQKGIDSVQANLTAGLALKVNISDTASMLSPYLTSNTAAATYVPQTRTITINGTSQDLTANRTYNVGTVTSVGATAGTGISVSGSPITSSGSFTITNTAPDQTVSLSAGSGISISGTYPSFTITNSSPSSGGTVTSVGSGTGLTGGPITTSGTLAVDTNLISTRLWRQKGVDSVAALANTKVSSVSGTSPISSSGGTSPTISISQASGSTNGFLSSTDWTTFNNKQNALTNPVTGTGTTNYVPKFTSSSAIGNSNLINDASGNLGLGVTPSAWLSSLNALQIGAAHLYGQTTGTGTVSIGNNNYLNNSIAWIYQYNGKATRYGQYDGQHEWYTAGTGTAGNTISFTQAMTLDASGRLGIGTTSPTQAKLVVQGDANSNTVFLKANSTTSQSYGVHLAAGTNSTDYAFRVTNQAENAEYLMVKGSGNVGIGTTSPTGTFDVRGTGVFGNGTSSYYVDASADATNAFVRASGTTDGMFVGTRNATAFRIFTNDSEKMRITSGGELLINTTSDAGDYKLQVNGNGLFTNSATGNVGVTIQNTNASYSAQVRFLNSTGTEKGALTYVQSANSLVFAANAIDALTLTSAGNTELYGSIKTAAPSGGTAKPYKWGEAGVAIGGSDGYAVKVEIDGTLYYLMTGFPPEPEPDPAAVPASGPSGNYKTYNKPTPTRSIQDTKIAALEKELAELKEMIKSIKK